MEKFRFDLGQTGFRLVPSQRFLKFRSGAESSKNATLVQVRPVFLEDVARAGHQNFLLGDALSAVPPLADQVRENNAEDDSITKQDVSSVALGNDPLGQGDANAEALLAVGVAILQVVVADFLVGKSLEGLGVLDPLFVDAIDSDVL